MAGEPQRKPLVYDPDQAPLSVHNRRVATHKGWKFDPDFHHYRDLNNFLVDSDGNAPANPVDSCK